MPSSSDVRDREEGPVPALLDRLFRRSAGRMVAGLTRTLGAENLDVVEDVVQEALLCALQLWPHQGVPANPEGWLYRVARNRALDRARRTTNLRDKLHLLATEIPGRSALTEPGRDDELVLIFLCCHPTLSPDSQIALVLKTAAGFSVDEIAAALLARPAAVAQRLARAKETLREAGAVAELPADDEMAERLDVVLHAIYLLFNEGYSAHVGETVVRAELCREAIRLAELLGSYLTTDWPDVHALLSLLCFQASRLPARADDGGPCYSSLNRIGGGGIGPSLPAVFARWNGRRPARR